MDRDDIANQICARIGCFDVAEWLNELAQTLAIDRLELMPVPVVDSRVVVARQQGLKLTVHHPHAGFVEEGDPARWVLTDAEFELEAGDEGTWTGALPLGLDKRASTPESVKARLGDATYGLMPADVAAGDFRQTYFMDDGLAVGITWNPALVDIERLHLTRLGAHMPFVSHDVPDHNHRT
ncbi:hypothetical protein [Burkholderia ubonensis]|uniref:hypothetical protein n=1 Tax=Burkholderia ubonensis TaxID=101571 RepID=UPI0012F8524C|nr:hypothetical protein [Burkholderia ubonensis]